MQHCPGKEAGRNGNYLSMGLEFALPACVRDNVALYRGQPGVKGKRGNPSETESPLTRAPGTYAILETSMGTIVAKLLEKEAPTTVANFVGLAEGTKEFTDPKTNQKAKRPFFDGLIFHRVIPDFMIQGGCPMGNGMGGPGYKFGDEFHPTLRHNKAGKLSMANSGPGTNGSQFFITVAETPWLDNRHSIFGEVMEGQDVANAISLTPRDGGDRPKTPVVLKSVRIERV